MGQQGRRPEKKKRRTSNARPSVGIEVRVDLVKEVEGSRVALLDRKDWRESPSATLKNPGRKGRTHSESDEGLLSSRELLDLKAFVLLRVERDANRNASVVLDAVRSLSILVDVHLVVLVKVKISDDELAKSREKTHGDLALLHDEPSPSSRHELPKDLRKVLGDLLERALDRLVLALVEVLDELVDRFLRAVEVALTLDEVVALLGEVGVLPRWEQEVSGALAAEGGARGPTRRPSC